MTTISSHTTPSAKTSRTIEFVQRIRERIATVVVGQDTVVERLLIALFTSNHVLLQGVPGIAKTLLASALSKTIDLQFSRVQFTIDLLPSDILGSEILDQRTNTFHVNQGPIFTNFLLADEINRAAPKVQGALLEAMQERKVTIGKETFKLPAPFLVIATQNPIEQSGSLLRSLNRPAGRMVILHHSETALSPSTGDTANSPGCRCRCGYRLTSSRGPVPGHCNRACPRPARSASTRSAPSRCPARCGPGPYRVSSRGP